MKMSEETSELCWMFSGCSTGQRTASRAAEVLERKLTFKQFGCNSTFQSRESVTFSCLKCLKETVIER